MAPGGIITVTSRALTGERDLTYRALADLTRDRDPEGRGVTYAHLCGLASGREYPSRRSLELIAASLELEPGYVAQCSGRCHQGQSSGCFCYRPL